MKHLPKSSRAATVNRREFVKGGSFATMMTLMGGVELVAQEAKKDAATDKAAGPQVKCGVIGLGARGREVLGTLALQKEATVAAICDTYAASLRRASEAAPKATKHSDYKEILANKEIQAVIIATPTHQHRQVVVAALAAGKHVYCEAPLANTIEDAQAIALAAKAAVKLVFQSGLQSRSDPQRHFLLQFIRSGAMGKNLLARTQWNKKLSWRFTSPNPERERELNWRLRKETSLGLVGEIGLHQIDAAAWFLNRKPTAVNGFGAVMHWEDGREVADTVQAVFEFPGGLTLTHGSTLANSFDSDHEVYFGTDSAIMVRGNKAWMFKEADAPLLGWEVYARKDEFYKETGIALVANATKLVAQGDKPVEDAPFANTPLSYALEAFAANVNEIGAAVEDFNATFNPNDTKALVKYLSEIKRQPAAGFKEGYEATVIAIKANEAVQKQQRVMIPKELFTLA